MAKKKRFVVGAIVHAITRNAPGTRFSLELTLKTYSDPIVPLRARWTEAAMEKLVYNLLGQDVTLDLEIDDRPVPKK